MTDTMSMHFKSVSSNCGKGHLNGINGVLGDERSTYSYLCPVNQGESLSLKVSSAEIPSMTSVLKWDFPPRTLTISEMLLFIYS